jgi:transglutaminase-like putative cysteine protease
LRAPFGDTHREFARRRSKRAPFGFVNRIRTTELMANNPINLVKEQTMIIRAGFDIAFELPQPTPMILMLSVHPSRAKDVLTDPRLVASPGLPMHNYRDTFGNQCTRVMATVGSVGFSSSFDVRDTGLPDEVCWDARRHPIEELPVETLLYLMGSKYCDTQKLSDFAWSTLPRSGSGWETVQAICDFVHFQIKFGYCYARDDRTAYDAFNERVGVCRDFAHLAVALCRCMNIPARYCTSYLGDIGVPPDPAPVDFSAWFEAFIGGRWFTFDARHNKPRIGRMSSREVVMPPTSRSQPLGRSRFAQFKVHTEESIKQPEVVPRGQLRAVA